MKNALAESDVLVGHGFERSQQAMGLDPKAVEWTIILLGLGLSVLLLAQNDRKKPLAYLVGFAVLIYIVVSGVLRG